MRIALVPNDDGYGPSALGYYIAKALLKEGHFVIVRNESALTLNAILYKAEISEGRVSLQPAFGGIRMRKTAGGVDTHGTLHDIRGYPQSSDDYRTPDDVDAVVDLGTPAAVRSAHAAKKPVFTVFDHSWGKTYEKTLENLIEAAASTLGVTRKADVANMKSSILASVPVKRSPVVEAIDRVKTDEAKSSAVFLFPSYIAPKPFYDHWRSMSVPTVRIKGVFGGSTVSPEKAWERMGISKDAPKQTVYVLGGGTPVWDVKLPKLISQLRDKNLKYNVVVFDRRAKPNEYKKVGQNVYTGGAVDGETVQGFLPGVDLVITRAGGGIVNDAIACRVPFVCVEEPNHWQVEMIRKNCMKKRLTRTISFEEFQDGDIARIVERELGNTSGNGETPGNEEIKDNMEQITNGMEDSVTDEIIHRCTAGRNTKDRTMPSSRRRGRRG